MTRRFEFIGGTSAKFWEIERTGSQVIVRYGRIGTVGQSQTKAFADGAAARTHANRLIDQKLAKGYAECAAA